ncbi:MAG: tripartite tricarboxylate transporter permease [Deltaproteobacteria bacterium]|jgi:TctA family transporter|nr:tripartite tricarboxylate transporter permease [Deltaproteobacteria bacterium]
MLDFAVAYQALHLLSDPYVIMVILGSALYGLFVGSIPGLTATMATALLVPVTFFMDPVPALAAMVSMEAMAIFSGDIPTTLVRIPGTPSSAAYVEDSFALCQQGKAAYVLGVDVTFSAIGGVMGALVLIVLAPMLAEVALKFSSFEYFWLACIGLSCSVMVSSSTKTKALISLIIGLLLNCVGMDITLGYPRFTFGSLDLLSGFSFIPAMIGMFGVAEIMRNVVKHESRIAPIAVQTGDIFKGVGATLKQYWRQVIRAGAIGTGIGALPGAGADIAAWVSYGVAKRFSKTPEKFGTGHIEGVLNATASNNASLGGAWVPALVFGIPGDSITAIIIGVLYMKNLRPGPGIFERSPEIIYAVYMTFILANLLLIPFGWAAIKLSTKVLNVPRNLLYPIILVFCIVGAYAINNTNFDVTVMMCLGILAYFMESNGIPVAPAILGMVLGNLLEESFMQSMMKVEWNLFAFFHRPIAAGLGIVAILIWVSTLFLPLIKKRFAPSRP